MKILILSFVLALFAPLASATYCSNGAKDYPKCTPPFVPAPQAQQQSQSQQQTQSQGQAIDMSLYTNPAASQNSGHTYVFPAPAAAAPLPSGLCPMGNSESWSVIWGFVSWAKSSMRTEHECLDKLIQYGKDTQPKPVQHVTNYIAPPPSVGPLNVPSCGAVKPAKRVVRKPAVCK